jgi:hypothetical protein
MSKNSFPRTFRYPSADLRDKVRAAVKERGFRTEQAFLIAACEHELQRGDNTEAMDDLEARIVATLANVAREVQALVVRLQCTVPARKRITNRQR